MTRWELITSDGYLEASIECILNDKSKIERLLKTFLKQYRDELLHGDQGIGCSDDECNVCYPHRRSFAKKRNK